MRKTKRQKQDICKGDRVILSAPQCEPVEVTVIKVLAKGNTLAVRADNSTGAVPDFYATREMCKKI